MPSLLDTLRKSHEVQQCKQGRQDGWLGCMAAGTGTHFLCRQTCVCTLTGGGVRILCKLSFVYFKLNFNLLTTTKAAHGLADLKLSGKCGSMHILKITNATLSCSSLITRVEFQPFTFPSQLVIQQHRCEGVPGSHQLHWEKWGPWGGSAWVEGGSFKSVCFAGVPAC